VPPAIHREHPALQIGKIKKILFLTHSPEINADPATLQPNYAGKFHKIYDKVMRQ
jgi:hypothetical protein